MVKQTNFRIDEETASLFRKFCEDNGMNQAQGFDHIMQVVELDRAKAVAPGRATEIESFEKSIKDVMAAFLNSIELNNNAEARVREQFASDLTRKDKTIDELREKNDVLNQKISTLMEEKEVAYADKVAAEEREKHAVEQMMAAKKNASDQERINSMLTAQLTDATEKLDGYDVLKKTELDLKAEVAELKRSLEEQKRMTENEIKQAQAQAALEMERSIMAKEREIHKEYQDMLRQADKENARLSIMIEQLQAQIKGAETEEDN